MSFCIDVSDEYTWPVEVIIPGNGKALRFTFDAVFRRLPKKKVDEMTEAAGKGELATDDMAAAILCGWKGLKDQDNEDIPYSESARENLFAIYPVTDCICEAYARSLTEGRRKN